MEIISYIKSLQNVSLAQNDLQSNRFVFIVTQQNTDLCNGNIPKCHNESYEQNEQQRKLKVTAVFF